ncbi:MAG TPA: heavy metal-binding domain-containing protein [Gaiellaceae bacterium]
MTDDREQRNIEALEAGGLPLAAQERLAELRRRGGAFFTSDLSVNEFLLAREAGFEPVTQVMGSSVYHVGWQQMPWASTWTYGDGGTAELGVLTDAWNEARRLAVGRLEEEARLAGADAVVGVRLDRSRGAWLEELVEFKAFGTAARSTRYDLGDGPVVSNLSGQEFAKLFAHGFWPVGLVADTSVTYVVSSWSTQRAQTGLFAQLRNQELTDYTQGLYAARANAMRRLERQAHELHADGIVGVQFEQHQEEREVDQNGKRTDLVVTVHVIGTAIVELAAAEPPPTYIAYGL